MIALLITAFAALALLTIGTLLAVRCYAARCQRPRDPPVPTRAQRRLRSYDYADPDATEIIRTGPHDDDP